MTAAPAYRNRIVDSGVEDPKLLVANPANWRSHPAGQTKALGGALSAVGWVQQVMVNRRTGNLVDGHARVALAVERGEPTVPVLYVDLEPDEEALVLATLDPIGAMATTNTAKLKELLAGVKVDEANLVMFLSGMGGGRQPRATDPDDVPAAEAEPYVQPGDLWQLGPHRVLCGDATSPADVARVLGGGVPRITVTDPPYGVDYDPAWRIEVHPGAVHREGRVTNDDRADWREAWELSPSEVLYIWHGGLHAAVVASGIVAAGFEIRAQIVWVKPSLVMGRGAYHWQHEPCFYAVRRGRTASWVGDRKQSTVWDIPSVHPRSESREDARTDHGTQKPVEAMARPLRNHDGDVYDPFLGSGTTLIAAEMTGRACFGIELTPAYAQIAIERWKAFTGNEAVRLETVVAS